MLDAGAGHAPYRSLFDHTIYESADFCEVDKPYYDQLTYVCDLSDIPVEDNRYDLILCTQVLEHVPEPNTILLELFRILKPGGELWLTAPLFFPEHEIPFDFYRYTQFGIRYLIEKSGFEIKEIDWLEGFLGTASFQLYMIARELPISPGAYGKFSILGSFIALLLKPLAAVLARVFAEFDRHMPYKERGFCKNYRVIAAKPLS